MINYGTESIGTRISFSPLDYSRFSALYHSPGTTERGHGHIYRVLGDYAIEQNSTIWS